VLLLALNILEGRRKKSEGRRNREEGRHSESDFDQDTPIIDTLRAKATEILRTE
jgi:hypothetical protein